MWLFNRAALKAFRLLVVNAIAGANCETIRDRKLAFTIQVVKQNEGYMTFSRDNVLGA